MSQALAISSDYLQASLFLKDLLDQLHDDLSTLSLNSAEVLQNLKQDLLKSWKKIPEALFNYKISLQNMPKGLRRRMLVKQTIVSIDAFDCDIRQFFSNIGDVSLQDLRSSLDQHIRKTETYLKGIRSRIDQMIHQVSDLEENELIQKFIKGETVLPSKQIIQWRRKLTHFLCGISFLYLFVYAGLPKSFLHPLAAVILFIIIGGEIFRHFHSGLNGWVCRVFGSIMREREKTKVNAAALFFVSMGFVYFVFPINVAILTMLFIAIGDPVAGIVGVLWGKRRISTHISLEGSLACFASCALLSAFTVGYLLDVTLSGLALLYFSLLGGLIGALAEASFKKIDDNLVIPLLSAPLLWVLMNFFSLI